MSVGQLSSDAIHLCIFSNKQYIYSGVRFIMMLLRGRWGGALL